MKIKLLLTVLALSFITTISFAQSVVITPKATVYKRPKPMSEYKKSFTVTYPKVRAGTPALSKKIETAISYEKNNSLNIKEELGELQWLEEASYEVNYNKTGILDITLSMTGSGAYPSTFSKTVVINSKTGNIVKPLDVFINLPGLAAKVSKAQQAEIRKAQIEYKKDPESADFDGSEYFGNAKFTTKQLENFSISDKGVTFNYNYGFPHVILALEPDGNYFYSWAELKPFIKRGGLLAQFIR
jgi:hypothetical protein